MDSPLSLSIIEIVVLMLGAIVLGITIHFFITSRRTLKASSPVAMQQLAKELEDWKLRYFNEIESRDKEMENLKKRLADAEENSNIYTIEAEETRKQNKKLQAEIESLKSSASPAAGKPGYIDQLFQAQSSLKEYNERINQLLGQIDIVKETEEKQQEILKNNEELGQQIDELKFLLSQKEKEISNIRQKQELTKEMTSMLDSAYNEFNVLQDKMQKLEGQVVVSKRLNIEYEDLKEEHYKILRDFEEQKLKYTASANENRELQATLAETEDKLREANFQRQQLQKKVAYLEELNDDMQAVADANKKLEGQIKRIGELESMLNMVAGERDELARKQMKA
ncbi:MAG: hypothetical protein ACT4OJ_03425 [Bacteroidota bacterium]